MNNYTNTTGSILKQLRALMPDRVLTLHEAMQRAELQASRLLSLHGIDRGPIPIEIVTEAPRIRIAHDWDMPVSGSAHWDGRDWVVTLNASEFELRQRFSLLHEYKHIIDHPTRHLISGIGTMNAEQMAEKVADYFAACVLMPKAWIKMAFCSETQKIEQLAEMFQVSPKAMSFRLNQLGLTTPNDRCDVRHLPVARRWPPTTMHRYHRALSANTSAIIGVGS